MPHFAESVPRPSRSGEDGRAFHLRRRVFNSRRWTFAQRSRSVVGGRIDLTQLSLRGAEIGEHAEKKSLDLFGVSTLVWRCKGSRAETTGARCRHVYVDGDGADIQRAFVATIAAVAVSLGEVSARSARPAAESIMPRSSRTLKLSRPAASRRSISSSRVLEREFVLGWIRGLRAFRCRVYRRQSSSRRDVERKD